jgi:hypothetical protein
VLSGLLRHGVDVTALRCRFEAALEATGSATSQPPAVVNGNVASGEKTASFRVAGSWVG